MTIENMKNARVASFDQDEAKIPEGMSNKAYYSHFLPTQKVHNVKSVL